MKLFLNPQSAGGVPLTNELLENLQGEAITALNQLFVAVGGSFVISGCDLLTSTATGFCTVSAGYVWMDGAVRKVEAYNGTFPYWVTPTDTYETRRFSNGGVQNVYVNNLTQFTTAQPTSGSSIQFNPDNSDLRYIKLVTKDVTASIDAERRSRIQTDADHQAQLDALKAATKVPIGGIVMWTNSIVPQGWAKCDGTQGTPDLRGRFIVGHDPNQTDYSVYGNTGGADYKTLSLNEIPNHNHNASDGQFGYNQLLRKAPLGSNTTADGTDGSGNGGSEPDITTSQPMASVGGGQPFDKRPPYYVLYFIMRIS